MRGFGFLSVLIAMGLGMVAYQRALPGGGSSSASPRQQIDAVGIKAALLAMGASERQYFASHGSYATIEQLVEDDFMTGGTERRGYVFTAVPDGSRGFTITAVPSDPARKDSPTLVIDDTLQVSQR